MTERDREVSRLRQRVRSAQVAAVVERAIHRLEDEQHDVDSWRGDLPHLPTLRVGGRPPAYWPARVRYWHGHA